MVLGRSRVAALALGSVIVVACGVRSGLVDDVASPPDDPAIRDASMVRDASALDAEPPPDRDSATPPPLDAGPGGTCSVGETFDVLSHEGPLAHPRLARSSDRALLVFTRQRVDAPHEVMAVPLDLRGRPVDEPSRIGQGRGGTVVGEVLENATAGFTASFVGEDGHIRGARFDSEGRFVNEGALGYTGDGLRTVLVLTSRFAANGWNPMDPAANAVGFVQDLSSRESRAITWPGRDPVGAASERPGAFRVAVNDGTRAVTTTMDATGAVLSTELHGLSDTTFPVSIALVRIAEGADDSVVLGGGTVRALQDAIVSLELGPASHEVFLPNDWLFDADAAYDPASGWLGVAAGIDHDEGVDHDNVPYVFFFGLTRDGRVVELTVAGPVDAATYVHPAILWTGLSATPFLVVWEDVGGTVIRGAPISCD